MLPWNWEEHNGKKTRVYWERQRANAKLAAIKAEFVKKHRAIDCEKAAQFGCATIDPGDGLGPLVTPCQPGSGDEYVVDPVASRLTHSGEIVTHETQTAWRKFCSEPHDPSEFDFDSVAAELGPTPVRSGLESGTQTSTAPPGLTTEPVKRGPGRPRKDERIEMAGV
jgi:hypothetical protein